MCGTETKKAQSLLIVDDEDNIVAALKRLLRRDGYHIVTASSGEEALVLLDRHHPGVVISDQRMPGMSGLEFLGEVKRRYPDTVRIMLSGYTDLKSVYDSVHRGEVYKYLTKPWDDEELRADVRNAFGDYSRNREHTPERPPSS